MDSCSCENCVSACKNDPGRLLPEQLSPLAAFLNVTVDELVISYLVKIPMGGKEPVYVYAPAKMKGRRFVAEPGSIIPDYYTGERGRCVFLDEKGLCSVHQVKPFECGAYMGCKNTFLGRPYREKQVEEYFYSRWKRYRGRY